MCFAEIYCYIYPLTLLVLHSVLNCIKGKGCSYPQETIYPLVFVDPTFTDDLNL